MSQTPRPAPEQEPEPDAPTPASPDAPPASQDAPTPVTPDAATPAPPGPSVLDEPTDDERGVGWNEPAQRDDRDDDWYLRERPPHHG